MHPAVGIDLGTTFSAVAYLDHEERPTTVRNAEGDLTTPSAVFFDRSTTIVGAEALEAGEQEPERLAQFAKRDVGEESFEKPIHGEVLPPEVIEALILKKLKADAELKLGSISKAVITVPAFFNEPCRKATQDAGRLAGLGVLDIINEPTAAAIMYGVEQGFLSAQGESHQRETILVYDLGGGTFDVTVMEIDGTHYKALATAGDVYLGGIDWDRRIVDYVAENFEEQFGVDPRQNPSTFQSLLHKANQAKHALSAREEMSIFFNSDGNRLRLSLSRQKFEYLTQDLLDRTEMTARMVLTDAGLTWQNITRLLLVGGSTRMPMVHGMLERVSGLPVDRSLSPDEAVAHGAAVYAGLLLRSGSATRYGMSVTNVNSHDLGVLGIEAATQRQRRQLMIPRNSRLPASQTEQFKTHRENQSNVKVKIVEGGDDSGNNATLIGSCVVKDLPHGLPAKTPVDVEFEYARNGRLRVRAWLPTVGREATLQLNRAAGLSETKFQQWKKRLEEGLSDKTLSTDIPGETTTADEQEDQSEQTSIAQPIVEPIALQPEPLPKKLGAPIATTRPRKKPQTANKTVKQLGQPTAKKLGKPKEQPEEGEAHPATDWKSRRKKLSGK